jgi:hypothetical protein
MPITQEQIRQFQKSQLPSFLNSSGFYPVREEIYTGTEAVVMQLKAKGKSDIALKWYASLEGRSYRDLVNYAAEIQDDEDGLYSVGLTQRQIPATNIHIEIGETPSLYSTKEWFEGRSLSEVSIEEMSWNRELRKSVINLLKGTDRFYLKTGHFPDIKLGEALYFFSSGSTGEPLFKESSNIIISNNTAVLHDTKAMRYPSGSIESFGLAIKQKMIMQTVDMLELL